MATSPNDLEEGEISMHHIQNIDSNQNNTFALKRRDSYNFKSSKRPKFNNVVSNNNKFYPNKYSKDNNFNRRSNRPKIYNNKKFNTSNNIIHTYNNINIEDIPPFSFPLTNQKPIKGFPELLNSAYDYVRSDRPLTNAFWLEWVKSLENCEKNIYNHNITEVLSLYAEYYELGQILHIVITDKNDNILMDNIVTKFRNSGCFVEHHIINYAPPPSSLEIMFSEIKKRIHEVVNRFKPCVLLLFDLNHATKRTLGLSDFCDLIYIRDVGRFPLIIDNYQTNNRKSLVDMVGNEMTRKKIRFKDEELNKKMPLILVREIADGNGYIYNEYYHKQDPKYILNPIFIYRQLYAMVTITVKISSEMTIFGQGLAVDTTDAYNIASEDVFRNAVGKFSAVLPYKGVNEFLNALEDNKPITAYLACQLLRYIYNSFVNIWEYWIALINGEETFDLNRNEKKMAEASSIPYNNNQSTQQAQQQQQQNPNEVKQTQEPQQTEKKEEQTIKEEEKVKEETAIVKEEIVKEETTAKEEKIKMEQQTQQTPLQQQQQLPQQYPYPYPLSQPYPQIQTPNQAQSSIHQPQISNQMINLQHLPPPNTVPLMPPPPPPPLPPHLLSSINNGNYQIHSNNNSNNNNNNNNRNYSSAPTYNPPNNNNSSQYNQYLYDLNAVFIPTASNNLQVQPQALPNKIPQIEKEQQQQQQQQNQLPLPPQHYQQQYNYPPPPPPPSTNNEYGNQQRGEIMMNNYNSNYIKEEKGEMIVKDEKNVVYNNNKINQYQMVKEEQSLIQTKEEEKQQNVEKPQVGDNSKENEEKCKTYLLDNEIEVELDDSDLEGDSDDEFTYSPHYELNAASSYFEQGFEEEKIKTIDDPLILIVDIDFTLLEAIGDDIYKTFTDYKPPESSIHKLIIRGKDLKINKHYHYTRFVKFRPGVVEMLKQLSYYYELYIYSQGLKEYVEEVVNIIDPDHSLFGRRIITREGIIQEKNNDKKTFETLIDTVKNKSRFYKHFSTEQLATCSIILDDRTDVWVENKSGLDPQFNLFKVKPYDYFSRYIDTTKKADLKDEVWEENYIKNITNTLITISDKAHAISSTATYSIIRDVREVMKEHRKTILEGCNLIFTGLIQKTSDSRLHPLWIDAENYGAKCYNEYNKDVITHVIVGKNVLTNKATLGRQHNKLVVTLDWFLDGLWNWIREPEDNYKI